MDHLRDGPAENLFLDLLEPVTEAAARLLL
jgi:hypothetical protein